MERILENLNEKPEELDEPKEPTTVEAMKVPKLVKPSVKTEPELIELYQTEIACW